MTTSLFCNTSNPSITKLAAVSNNKLTKIQKLAGGKITCLFNGKRILVSEARKQMLKENTFIDAQGKIVK